MMRLAAGRLALCLVLSFTATVRAKAPDESARTRATLYQAEASKLLAEYHWVIASSRPGRFVAVHDARIGGGAGYGFATIYGPRSGDQSTDYFPHPVAYLTITFQPDTVTSTGCVVHLVGYFTHTDKKTGKREVSGPFAIDSPENTKYIKDKMTTAEKRLVRKHPEYGGQ